jgi:hypothetical protein
MLAQRPNKTELKVMDMTIKHPDAKGGIEASIWLIRQLSIRITNCMKFGKSGFSLGKFFF